MSTETVTMQRPTAEDRQHAAAILRSLADQIEAEDQPTDTPGPRPRLDRATIQLDREWDEPIVCNAYLQERLMHRLLGKAITLRLHWRMG